SCFYLVVSDLVLFTLLVFLSVFFYDYGPPADLHSFPTRRSSDLPAMKRIGMNTAASDVVIVMIVNPISFEPLSAASNEIGFTIIDRKSTRLNSSHVAISYAAFCLKKKRILFEGKTIVQIDPEIAH